MQITYINNDGAGFADRIEIEDGITIQQLFTQRMPQGNPADYLIRVNRQPTTSDYVLQPGDRVSVTPTKIEGAGHAVNSSEETEVCTVDLHSSLILPPVPQPLTFTSKESSWEPANGSIACTSQEF